MDQGNFEPLSAAELADIDAKYVPYPPFANWPGTVPREELWDRDRERFAEVSTDASESDLRTAQEVALRTAAFDTGAIEGLYPTDRGLTFTVATQAAAWEQTVNDRSKNALRLFEAQLEAFELVLDLATDHFPAMTQSWVRRLHEVVTAPQETYVVITPAGPQEQPLPKGEYKKYANHVRTPDGGVHAYAPVEATQPEMQRLIDEIDTDGFRSSHPILQASYVHYALAAIHPFADGNGRVARAMASAYTYRAVSVPLVVLAHQRDRYFAALAKADMSDPVPFVEFIGAAGRDGLETVTERLRTAQAPQPEKILEEFAEMFVAQGDLSHQQLDGLANSVVDELIGATSELAGSLTVPDGVDIQWVAGQGGSQDPIPGGFRSVVEPGPRYVQIDFLAAPPGNAEYQTVLDIFVSTESDTASSIMIRSRVDGDQIVLGLADLVPHLSSAARLRLESFLERILGKSLGSLLARSRKRLERLGY